jgi:probable F420-dependent oxidoreductase
LQHADYDSIRRAAQEAENIGVDIVFNYDHFFPLDGDPDGKVFECWTVLGAWAESTSRVEIGALVSCNAYRNPDLLADMARTVDHISGGRLVLGLGAGWYEKDYTTYGYEFGTWKSRFDLFDAGLKRIEARMGQLNPPPVRKIPVLIGGSGPKRTLPAVARYADIWHTVLAAEAFTEASAQVDELAAAIGRDGKDIERSVHWFGAESADVYRQAGATTFTTEIDPDPTTGYYDFSTLEEMLAWRDRQK